MEIRVSLYVTINNETGSAVLRSHVSIWDDAELKYNAVTYQEPTAERPAQLGESMYPYAVAVIRNASDRFVADLLDRIARGEEVKLHEINFSPLSLHVGAGFLTAGRP
jgi:hypothetical protein